jgi:8-oxo-dGTP diphosphatase
VEAGERPEAALVRELREELGIAVDPDRLEPAVFASADNAGRHMLLLLYLCRAWEGEPRPLDAVDLKWLTPGEMLTADMPPADVPLVAALERLI